MTGEPRPLFLNPGSGPDRSPGVDDLQSALGRYGYVTETVDDVARLPDLLRAAVARSVPSIGVAGGDGTVRCAAEVLAGTGVPLLVVPAGTRNHFARELGIDDLDAAAGAAGSGHVRRVSLGRVGPHAFVNNASIGLYPSLVRRRERHQLKRSKPVAGIVAGLSIARHGRPVQVVVDGGEMSAWIVFIGNGRYGEGFTDLVERDSLESAVLDVRVLRADRPLARMRVAAALAVGRMTRSPLVWARESRQVSIGVPRRRVDVALDGEVFTLEAPLRFSVAASELAVIAPPPADGD